MVARAIVQRRCMNDEKYLTYRPNKLHDSKKLFLRLQRVHKNSIPFCLCRSKHHQQEVCIHLRQPAQHMPIMHDTSCNCSDCKWFKSMTEPKQNVSQSDHRITSIISFDHDMVWLKSELDLARSISRQNLPVQLNDLKKTSTDDNTVKYTKISNMLSTILGTSEGEDRLQHMEKKIELLEGKTERLEGILKTTRSELHEKSKLYKTQQRKVDTLEKKTTKYKRRLRFEKTVTATLRSSIKDLINSNRWTKRQKLKIKRDLEGKMHRTFQSLMTENETLQKDNARLLKDNHTLEINKCLMTTEINQLEKKLESTLKQLLTALKAAKHAEYDLEAAVEFQEKLNEFKSARKVKNVKENSKSCHVNFPCGKACSHVDDETVQRYLQERVRWMKHHLDEEYGCYRENCNQNLDSRTQATDSTTSISKFKSHHQTETRSVSVRASVMADEQPVKHPSDSVQRKQPICKCYICGQNGITPKIYKQKNIILDHILEIIQPGYHDTSDWEWFASNCDSTESFLAKIESSSTSSLYLDKIL